MEQTARGLARYGWIPDLPDQRDHLFAAVPEAGSALPATVDLRPRCPAVYDQGSLQSCTANAIAAAIQFERGRQGLPDMVPSRLFIYYYERALEGTIASDSGAQIRDGIKTVARQGVPPEPEWPYDVHSFDRRPPDAAYRDATLDRAVGYQRLARDLTQMRSCLASGFPFVTGFTAYDSFESGAVARSGQVGLPAPGERPLGGHAVLAVGYDDSQQSFLMRNSWGPGWGIQGHFTLPYRYLAQPGLAKDFWTIRLVGS